MASTVKAAKLHHQQANFTDVVGRGRGHLVSRKPGTNQYALTTQVGGVGWHKGVGPHTEADEIDTALVASSGTGYDWQMTQADYTAHIRALFNAGDIIRYTHPASGEWIIFDPQSINWNNQDYSQHQIAIKQPVSGTVDDDTITYTGAYGSGRDWSFTCDTARLQKLLTIANPLPAPAVSGTVHFVAEFSLKMSSGLSFYLDGVLWLKANGVRVKTGSHIECRDSQGNTLFWLRAPAAWDSAAIPQRVMGELEVRRQGGPASLFITVRIPKAFFDTAVYPVFVDPTVDVSVGAGADDGKTGPSADYSNSTQNWAGNFYGAWNMWLRFTGISGLAGVTIDASYISNSAAAKFGSPNVRIYAQRADAPTAPTSTSDYNSRTVTTAFAAWTGNATPSPSLNSVLQELVDSHNPSAILILAKNNGSAANENYYDYPPYDWGSTNSLHIEYTADGGEIIECTAGNVSVSGQATGIVPGSVSVATAAALLGLLSQVATVAAKFDLSVATAVLGISGQVAAVAPGGVQIPANAGALALGGQTVIVAPGGISIQTAVGALSLTGEAVLVVSGGSLIQAAPGVLSLAGQAATIAPGAVAIPAAPGVLSLAGQAVIVSPGGISVQTAVGALSLTGEAVLVLSGGSIIQVSPGALALDGPTAVIIPGGVLVSAGAGALALGGQSATIVPGAVGLSLATAVLGVAGLAAGVLPGRVNIQAAAGALALSGPAAAVLPGAVAVAAAAGVLQVSGLSLESIGEAAFAALGRPFAADEIARFFAQGVMTFDAQGVMTFVAT